METGITKMTESRMVTFIEKGIETIEGALQVANFLIESRIIPYHFYEKTSDGKPDFSKGKVGAVAAVLVHGIGTLKLPAMTALQNIIPVNGLLSIKGDLAKSMIFSSGKLRKDSWKETVTGTIEGGDMEITITATREDNGLTLSRSFSINDAKRAGLWITEQQVNGTDGWKYKSSPWWKHQKRMLYYRPLGYLARDLFGDVLNEMYITEEAVDIVKETEEIITTADGNKIIIPDKEHSKARSDKMTTRVADRIKDPGFGEVKQTIMQPTVINVSNEDESVNVEDPLIVPERGSIEVLDGKELHREPKEGELTLAAMEKMETSELLKIINTNMDLMEAMQILPGKNTNKKLREIIFAHQEGRLSELLPNPEDTSIVIDKVIDVSKGEIPLNKAFDQQKADKAADDFLNGPSKPKEETSTNKYGLEIPPFDKGQSREFSTVKAIFNKMMYVSPQITTPRYMELAQNLGLLEKYSDKEKFCRDATIAEINLLLDAN